MEIMQFCVEIKWPSVSLFLSSASAVCIAPYSKRQWKSGFSRPHRNRAPLITLSD